MGPIFKTVDTDYAAAYDSDYEKPVFLPNKSPKTAYLTQHFFRLLFFSHGPLKLPQKLIYSHQYRLQLQPIPPIIDPIMRITDVSIQLYYPACSF